MGRFCYCSQVLSEQQLRPPFKIACGAGRSGSLPLRASPMPSSVVLDLGVNSNEVFTAALTSYSAYAKIKKHPKIKTPTVSPMSVSLSR